LIRDFVPAKLVELTPCERRSDKYRIYAAKELKQYLKHCKQLRKLYLQTEKLKKKMLLAINQKTALRGWIYVTFPSKTPVSQYRLHLGNSGTQPTGLW
jgi:DNA-binding transcriptional MerR regulator